MHFQEQWAQMSADERKACMKRAQGYRAAMKEMDENPERFLPKPPKPPRVRKTSRELTIKAKYDLTPEQWDDRFEEQGRCCGMCKSPTPGSKLGWHTDHCHVAKRVRAILCHHCNSMLGHAKDDIERLQAGVLYLKKHAPWRFQLNAI